MCALFYVIVVIVLFIMMCHDKYEKHFGKRSEDDEQKRG